MLFSSRVANLAATFIALTTLAGLTVSSKALGADRDATLIPAIATTATTTTAINPSVPKPVPSIDPADGATTSSDEVRSAAPAPAPGLQFASLAAAVASQDFADDADSELSCLAGAVYFESKGEPLSGQLAVADVIINRTKSGRFPASICSVVTQRGQFSFVRGGHIPTIANSRAYRTAIAVARVAMADAWENPAGDAMYFHARRVSPAWRMQKVASIGNHIFYR